MISRLALQPGTEGADFHGAKLGLICGEKVLAYLRDDHPNLRWAARWDLPGGGREGEESPEACVLRELQEEFGLSFGRDRLEHGFELPSMSQPGQVGWFFLGHIAPAEVEAIRFGEEGAYWRMMRVADFLIHPEGIPPLQQRLSWALKEAGWRIEGLRL